jgi:hypothetical protein
MSAQEFVKALAAAAPNLNTLAFYVAAIAGIVFFAIGIMKFAKIGEGSREDWPVWSATVCLIVGVGLFNLGMVLNIGSKTISMPGISYQDVPSISTVKMSTEMLGALLTVLRLFGVVFAIKSLFMFAKVPGGDERFGKALATFGAGIVCVNANTVASWVLSWIKV